MANLGTLPPEIILLISEQLSPKEQSQTKKKDIFSLYHVNRHLRAVVEKDRFHKITLTLTLQDTLPSEIQEWQPQAWKTPGIMDLLLSSAAARSHVKHLQLRVYLCPMRDWTKTSFDDIKEQLRVNTQNWRDQLPGHVMHRDSWSGHFGTKGYPQSIPRCQELVIAGYGFLFMQRCSSPPGTRWTQNPEPLLRSLLDKLPSLQELEAADPGYSQFLLPRSLFEVAVSYCKQWSMGYADTLVLRTAPSHVTSIGFRSWPPMPRGLRWLHPESDLTNHTSDAQRLQDFVRKGGQFTGLTIDLVNDTMTCIDNPFHPALSMWGQGLRQLRNLTTLTLSRSQQPDVDQHVYSLAQPDASGRRHLDPRLEELLGAALVVDRVKHLRLEHWKIEAKTFRARLAWSFPELETLHLDGIAIVCEKQRQGEVLWQEWMDAVRERGRVRVTVTEPKVYAERGDLGYGTIGVRSRARLALEATLRH